MKCELDYCVYNRKNVCILDEIEVNGLGMCACCMTLSFTPDFLEQEKERQLREMEEGWGDTED
ncbi:MAG: hypothetical protein FWF49_03995 [Oscillospiraceae bacterium]|nr:hypothetical protein [Oscillospiraceae bacterium]